MSGLTEKFQKKLSSKLDQIDPYAVRIISELQSAGFHAYLVGGCIRDLLADIPPKDFDIATDARPQQVKKKISRSFIIGRRFKLVHVIRGEHIFEVATFRRDGSESELQAAEEDELRYAKENFFGSIEEDTFRRDFTINALYFDPNHKKVVDYSGGLQDIQSGIVRTIRDPRLRIPEDPIRILRAIRFSLKLNFTIESSLKNAMLEFKDTLKTTAPPRRREEWIKIFRLHNPQLALLEMFDLGVLESALPTLNVFFQDKENQENFCSQISQFRTLQLDFKQPENIFLGILFSYVLCFYKPKTIFDLSADAVKANGEIKTFASQELGLTRLESELFHQTLEVLKRLASPSSYSKKGERRKKSFISNRGFHQALELLRWSGHIDPSTYLFWQNEVERFSQTQT